MNNALMQQQAEFRRMDTIKDMVDKLSSMGGTIVDQWITKLLSIINTPR